MRSPRLVHYAAVVAILIGYFALRFWNITTSCLWFDEIFSVHASEHSWGSILSFVAQDLIHPPLFYLLLKLWITIGGEGLFWLRLFPVLFSILTVFPFLSLCRELKLDIWSKIIAFFFFATNGSLIKYAQEVRMYSLLLCLSLFSMWLFVRYFEKGKSFVPLLLVNSLLVYSHYFGWFVVVAEVVAILIFQRVKIKQMLLMIAVVFASFMPWIIEVWQASRAGAELGQNIGWMTRPGPFALGQFVLNLIEPFYYSATSVDPVSVYKVSVPIVLILVLTLIFRFVDLAKDESKQTDWLLGMFVATPVVAAFVASWILPYSIWGTRHLIIIFAPVSIMIGLAVGQIQNRTIKVAGVSLILLFTGLAFFLQSQRQPPSYIWCAWEPLASEVATKEPANVYVFEDLIAYHFWFALHNSEAGKQIQLSKLNGFEGVNEDTSYFLPRGFDSIKTVSNAEFTENRFWIAYRGDRIDEFKPPLSIFVSKGYRVADRIVVATGTGSAFIVLLEK